MINAFFYFGIFHRYGQKKPCYIYRLITTGFEDKIYAQQVNKQSLINRIMDNQQSKRIFKKEELKDYFTYIKKGQRVDGEQELRMLPALNDNLLLNVLKNDKNGCILSYHEHDSLLENVLDYELSEKEKEDALKRIDEWNEKRRRKQEINQMAQDLTKNDSKTPSNSLATDKNLLSTTANLNTIENNQNVTAKNQTTIETNQATIETNQTKPSEVSCSNPDKPLASKLDQSIIDKINVEKKKITARKSTAIIRPVSRTNPKFKLTLPIKTHKLTTYRRSSCHEQNMPKLKRLKTNTLNNSYQRKLKSINRKILKSIR